MNLNLSKTATVAMAGHFFIHVRVRGINLRNPERGVEQDNGMLGGAGLNPWQHVPAEAPRRSCEIP